MWTMIWLASTVFGGDNLEQSDRLAPGWQGNAWGPEATKARAEGLLPKVAMTPAMKQWDDWGKKALKSGDIIFRMGDAKILRGYFPMSRFLANISGSVFSHTGIASIEDGEVWVYDTTTMSVRRQPLCVWVLDNIGSFGVKRVKPELAAYADKAVAFCKEQFRKQTPFDYTLNPDDAQLYCIEMCEKAYRNNGLPLAPPVKLGDMENVSEFPLCVMGFLQFTDLTLDLPVYFPGNERHGIWSSPSLTTVVGPPGGVTARLRKTWFGRNSLSGEVSTGPARAARAADSAARQ
jgi:Permuted papain-like amidase enzyme, YaeF/YiiX, C92 family